MSVPAPRRALLIVVAVILALYVWIAGSSTLWDRDEPRYARATIEMIRSGDYVVPTFNGDLRPDKPILIYWLMSVPARLFGPSELSLRLVSPLAVALTCWLVFVFARRHLDADTGWMAALMYPLCALTVASGTAATTDAVLVACVTASLVVAAEVHHGGFGLRTLLGFGALLGLALLTKGPVGLALPVLTVIGALLLDAVHKARPRWGKWIGFLLAASLVGIAIFVAWGIPANILTDGAFAQKGLGRHVLDRATQPLETHGGNNPVWALFYIPILLVGFFPGLLFLPAGLAAFLRKTSTVGPTRSFVLSWCLVPIVFMSLIATKLPHYVLPAWPALSLIAAVAVRRAETRACEPSERRWQTFGRRLFVAVGIVLGVSLLVGPWYGDDLEGLRLATTALGLIVLGITFAGRREHAAGRYRSALLSVCAGMVIFFGVTTAQLLPGLERFKLSAPIARIVKDGTADAVPVATLGYFEPTLVYYLDRKVTRLKTADEAAEWMRSPGRRVLVTTRRETTKLAGRLEATGIDSLGAVSGKNISTGKRHELLALLKTY